MTVQLSIITLTIASRLIPRYFLKGSFFLNLKANINFSNTFDILFSRTLGVHVRCNQIENLKANRILSPRDTLK